MIVISMKWNPVTPDYSVRIASEGLTYSSAAAESDSGGAYIELRAETTKNRRSAIIPLDQETASAMASIKPDRAGPLRHVFYRSLSRRETVKQDLKAARIPVLDDRWRKLDFFYALRTTFCILQAEQAVHEQVRRY